MVNEAISVIIGNRQLRMYEDLLAKVRGDGQYHSIKELVQPDDPQVSAIAQVLMQTKDFIAAAHEFVDSFTIYRKEVGDYWRTPSETITAATKYREALEKFGEAYPPECDCDDKAILLCSILRNYIPADLVYCAFGMWLLNGEESGHMWVVTEGGDGDDVTIEATTRPWRKTGGRYSLYGIFNDKYAFSTDIGLREFDLKTVELIGALSRR